MTIFSTDKDLDKIEMVFITWICFNVIPDKFEIVNCFHCFYFLEVEIIFYWIGKEIPFLPNTIQ